MYSAVIGCMVSSTTTLTTSARASVDQKASTTMKATIRNLSRLFIDVFRTPCTTVGTGVHKAVLCAPLCPPVVNVFLTPPILRLFGNPGANFFQIRSRDGHRSRAPSGQVRPARNQPCSPFVSEIGPGPLDENQQPVAEADQEQNVHEQPR